MRGPDQLGAPNWAPPEPATLLVEAMAPIFNQERPGDHYQNLTVITARADKMVGWVGPSAEGPWPYGTIQLTAARRRGRELTVETHRSVPGHTNESELDPPTCDNACLWYSISPRAFTTNAPEHENLARYSKGGDSAGFWLAARWIIHNDLHQLASAPPTSDLFSAYTFNHEGQLGRFRGHVFTPQLVGALRQVRLNRFKVGRQV